jgi:hypothetical protein
VGAGSYIGRVLLRSVVSAGGGGKAAGGGGGGSKATGAWSTSPSGGQHTQPPASPPPAASPPLAFELRVHAHAWSHAAACLVEPLPRKGREPADRPPHEGLPAHLTVDETLRLLLTARDKYGNRRGSGGDGWTVSLDEVSEGAPRPPPLPGSSAARAEPWVWACEVPPSSLPHPSRPLQSLFTSSAAPLHLLCSPSAAPARPLHEGMPPLCALSTPSASRP